MFRLAEKARTGESATIGWIAETEVLPRKYLEQVVRDLHQANLIDSKPGPGGGCRLARPAHEISVGDVVRALDGEIQPGHCLGEDLQDHGADCPGCWGLASCAMREVWTNLQTAINHSLDSTTIADLLDRQAELLLSKAANYQI
jgi:Rrf2 family protein